MSSKQTAVVPNRDDASVNKTPYTVIHAGQSVPQVKAVRLVSPITGAITVELTVPVQNGIPAIPVSTMDATARRINPNARVKRYGKTPNHIFREYVTR